MRIPDFAAQTMSSTGLHSIYLGEEARVDLHEAAQSDDLKWFGVGFSDIYDDAPGFWYGHGPNAPILRVTYTLPVAEIPVISLSDDLICVGDNFTISWTPVEGATGYNVYRNGDLLFELDGDFWVAIDPEALDAYVGSNSFTLEAYNSCGGVTSQAINITIIDNPVAPAILTDSDYPFCVNEPYAISWSAVNSATGYEISVDRGSWTNVPGKGGGTSFSVDNPAIGDHLYFVRAFNSCGSGARSALSITVSAVTPSTPAAPISDITTPMVDESYTISWNESSGATNYELWENPTTIWSLIYSGPNSSISVSRSDIKTYYYFVKASNSCGNSSNSQFLELNVIEACCGNYTSGQTGNTDCDILGKRNLSDITTLIDHIFLTKIELCCAKNGNVNADTKVNLADITRLIDNVFLTKAETEACQ